MSNVCGQGPQRARYKKHYRPFTRHMDIIQTECRRSRMQIGLVFLDVLPFKIQSRSTVGFGA